MQFSFQEREDSDHHLSKAYSETPLEQSFSSSRHYSPNSPVVLVQNTKVHFAETVISIRSSDENLSEQTTNLCETKTAMSPESLQTDSQPSPPSEKFQSRSKSIHLSFRTSVIKWAGFGKHQVKAKETNDIVVVIEPPKPARKRRAYSLTTRQRPRVDEDDGDDLEIIPMEDPRKSRNKSKRRSYGRIPWQAEHSQKATERKSNVLSSPDQAKSTRGDGTEVVPALSIKSPAVEPKHRRSRSISGELIPAPKPSEAPKSNNLSKSLEIEMSGSLTLVSKSTNTSSVIQHRISRESTRSENGSVVEPELKNTSSTKIIALSETLESPNVNMGPPSFDPITILVLKIFSGNYDFKATYKTVAVTKDTLVRDVLKMALIRFRVSGTTSERLGMQSAGIASASGTLKSRTSLNFFLPGTENDYCLSVVHGDSKEKILDMDSNILEILGQLQSKSVIPGVAPSSQKEILQHMKSVTAAGKISSIRTPNDREIKFLLNRKLPQTEDEQRELGEKLLFRVYYFEDHYGTGTICSCKTLVLLRKALIKDLLKQSILKFKLGSSKIQYALYQSRWVAMHPNSSQRRSGFYEPGVGVAPGSTKDKYFIEPTTILDSRLTLDSLLRRENSPGMEESSDPSALVLQGIPGTDKRPFDNALKKGNTSSRPSTRSSFAEIESSSGTPSIDMEMVNNIHSQLKQSGTIQTDTSSITNSSNRSHEPLCQTSRSIESEFMSVGNSQTTVSANAIETTHHGSSVPEISSLSKEWQRRHSAEIVHDQIKPYKGRKSDSAYTVDQINDEHITYLRALLGSSDAGMYTPKSHSITTTPAPTVDALSDALDTQLRMCEGQVYSHPDMTTSQ
jgi:hypothetical protein